MVFEIQTIIRLMIETWMIVLWMIVSYPGGVLGSKWVRTMVFSKKVGPTFLKVSLFLHVMVSLRMTVVALHCS